MTLISSSLNVIQLVFLQQIQNVINNNRGIKMGLIGNGLNNYIYI